MKYPYILFDLDGTLIDSNELILTSFMYSLEQFNPGKYTREDVQNIMGKPLLEMMTTFNAENAEELVRVYRKHNLEHHDSLVTSFPNVVETLKTLHENGHKMALVTTKQRQAAMKGLALFGLDQYLEATVCLDDTDKHKPDPEPLRLAMQAIHADPEKTIMVGDNPADILGAHNTGVASCAVSWSMRGAEYLKQYNPDYLIDDMLELLDIVK
ncbi:pyrophosphatase [Desulfuribacillus stibiiarsenatis]|uniref:Pyrophosphatase n=1 Tax=Desulfuribacillus stibiiarsenatis TaxID=1390249 RepID=A0A1E5L9H6_9FIRM|nr:pyrophosphatase PpaX [Desulfuribacillus stibiiarsenatis]OEH86805.1 pyrophosphatase [Desulfuribacillus stibiiarsenatis]